MPLRDEIFEQPGVLQGWLNTELDSVGRIADAIRQRAVDFVFIAARGTSDHAGVYAQYVWGSRNRLPVMLAAPSLFTRYNEAPRVGKALVIGISQSGQSPDVVQVVTEGRQQGALTLAITNDLSSPLARAAELTLGARAGLEKAVAATKTYTAELLSLAALSVALSGSQEGDLAALRAVPQAMQAALALDSEIEAIASGYRSMGNCVVLGRGYNYATAQEWALKLKELAYIFTDVYSTADFQHGPIAVLEPGFPVFAVAVRGAVFEDELALLKRLRDDHGADLLVISDDEEALRAGRAGLRLPGNLPEWLTPIGGIVPAQLFCYHLARLNGYDTEKPRTLRKITLTH